MNDSDSENALYPEPGHTYSNPYPVLPSVGKNIGESYGYDDGFDVSDEEYQPVEQDNQAEYHSLAEQYQLNNLAGHSEASWRFPGQDGIGYGAPDTIPTNWSFHDTYGDDGHTDIETDVGVLGKPKENVFLHVMRNAELDAKKSDSEMPDASAASDDEPDSAPDLSSHRGTGTGRGRVTSKAGRRRGWKQLLKGTTHDPLLNKDDPKRARGTGRRARGRARAIKNFDPGREFKDHLQNANQAYLKGDYKAATEAAILAVQANPEIFQAHNILSDSLEKLGRHQDAIAALMCGAYTAKDPNVWILVADRTLDHAGEQRSEEDLDQALFCYSTAVKMQPDLYNARASKLAVLLEKEDWSKASLEAKALHRLRPTDIDIKKTYAELCVMTEDPAEMDRAKDAYEVAFVARMDTDLPQDELPDYWSHLNVYLDLVDRNGNPTEGISQLKKLARWILGRRHETAWDRYIDNDCEFDCGSERRASIPEFQQGIFSTDRLKYGDSLPLELRVKFGVFRMKMGTDHFDEAMRHFDVLMTLVAEVADYYDMFFQVAETLKKYQQFPTAIEFYKPILGVPDVANVELYMSLGACHIALSQYDIAIGHFKQALELDQTSRKIRLALMKAYSAIGQHEAALQIAPAASVTRQGETTLTDYEDNSSSDDGDASSGDETTESEPPRAKRRNLRRSLPRSKKKPTQAVNERKPSQSATVLWQRAKEQETDAFRLYTEIKHLTPLLKAEPSLSLSLKWTSSAEQLLQMFREMPLFYPKGEQYYNHRGVGPLDNPTDQLQRDVQALRNRLERQAGRNANEDKDDAADNISQLQLDGSIPLDFLNISFVEWHRIFVEYAILSARLGKQQISYDTVQQGLFGANVFFYDQTLHNTSLAAAICIATMYNDSIWLHNLARRFITSSDYVGGMTLQLAAGLARLTYGPNHYSSGPSQKFMLRVIKIHDALGMSGELRAQTDWGLLGRAISVRLEKYGDSRDLDPGLLLLYGHQVAAAAQSYAAMPYYLRSLALNPGSACTLLSLTVMQIANAMKRQTENRQYGIAMGLAFLGRYCELRKASGRVSHLQELKYNTGRIWHTLGLTDLAITCYEETLALSGQVREELSSEGDDQEAVEDFAVEAAFALQNIYSITGNQEAAMRITEEWLVL